MKHSTDAELNLCEYHGLPIIKTGGNCEPLCQKCLGLSARDADEMLGNTRNREARRKKQKNSFSQKLRDSFAKKNQKDAG